MKRNSLTGAWILILWVAVGGLSDVCHCGERVVDHGGRGPIVLGQESTEHTMLTRKGKDPQHLLLVAVPAAI